MPAIESSVLVDAPPDVLMGLICDFGSYPDFLPETVMARPLKQEGSTWEVRFGIQVIRRLEYTLRLTRSDDLHLSWTLVDGPFRTNEGSWTLEPVDGGRRTRALYRIDLQVGMFVPGNIVRSLTERTLPDTLARFKAEAERRHQG